ncbi:insulin receptor-like, partial [Paramuricea clavata]
GTNIAKVLTEHLGSLKTINGYLVVRQSTPLISLNFFKNLTSIVTRGGGFSPKDYALAIFDNPNLESLWDFHPNFKIIGGGRSPEKDGVFVQLNPRLCLYNIYPLIDDVLKLNRSDPAVDISKTTNGNARLCNVSLVNITITPLKCPTTSLCVRVSWPNNLSKEDYRNVLLYSVWYRETTSTDLNEYDDIDACNSDHVWNRQDVTSLRQLRRETIVKRVGGLKAYTQYAFRVEAIVIAGTGIKSSITYYKTKQTKPSVPRSLEVSFLSSSSLQVKWKKPFFPNGEITHYVVRYHESQSSYLWNMKINWCKNIDSSINFIQKREEKNEGTSMNNSCPVNRTCDCENEKNTQSTPDLQEALFARDFQDTILTTVFTKNDDNDKYRSTRRPTTMTLPNVVRNRTTSVSQGCDNNNKNSSCSTASPKTLPTSNPATVMSTSPQPTAAPAITLNTTSQTIILKELKYFTDYTVEVCACNVGAGCGENRLFRKQCSTAIGRTEKNDTADNIGDSLTYNAKNSTKEFTLYWEAPGRPNGAVLRYEIWIQYPKIRENETETATKCASSSKTEYEDRGASSGNYAARVRTITPVGNGSWSNIVTFKFTEPLRPPEIQSANEDVNLVTVIGVSIAAVLVAVVIFAILTYSFIQRHKKSGSVAGVLFSSTNPEYWNCSDVYVPDEWEVPRHNVTLIRELGNGSFGMVWEGEAVGILPGVDCCKVAVKTVSDNSSIRDKVEFLKEASIMK